MPSAASRPAPVELLAAFDDAMKAAGLRWYVFGAQAVVAHGRPRMTADVDVTVELEGLATRGLVELLAKHGFALRIELEDSVLQTLHLLPMLHGGTRMPLDLVIARPGLQLQFLARCRTVDIGGRSVPLISAEDLVVTKLLAARRKDLDDARGVLLAQWESIDLAYIDATLSALETALDDAKLKPRFSRVVGRVRGLMAGGSRV